MNITLVLRQSPKQSTGSVLLTRLRSLVAATVDRERPVKVLPRPYSFLSECECPHDCLRDHENE